MANNRLKELEAARAKLARLEKSIAKDLAKLPAKYGYSSAEEFAQAVTAAAGGSGRGGRRRGRPPGSTKAAKSGPGRKRRSRSVITDDTRAQVKKLVEGGKTGAEIAKTVGISLPSVQNIKKALGLVKKR
jgi:DNA-binding NarL/FixJ family response regulator